MDPGSARVLEQEALLARHLAALGRADVPLPRALALAERGLPAGTLRAAVSEAQASLRAGTELGDEVQPLALALRRATVPAALDLHAAAAEARAEAVAAVASTRWVLALGTAAGAVALAVAGAVFAGHFLNPDVAEFAWQPRGPWTTSWARVLLAVAGVTGPAVGVAAWAWAWRRLPRFAPGSRASELAAALYSDPAAAASRSDLPSAVQDYLRARAAVSSVAVAAAEVAELLADEGRRQHLRFAAWAPLLGLVVAVPVVSAGAFLGLVAGSALLSTAMELL